MQIDLLGEFRKYMYLCTMNFVLVILTDRECFMLAIGCVIYVVLFIVTIQNSRRKMLLLQERINKVRTIQEQQQASTLQSIEVNKQKVEELEKLIKKLGDENTVLKLELEEKKARLDYDNKMAQIENEKRGQAETVIFGSEIYQFIMQQVNKGKSLGDVEYAKLEEVVNSVYTSFTERLYSLYRLSHQEYRVSLLIKAHVQPKDIATLTAHSKESIASTRSRLYQKVFGQKGSSKDWDEFILSL